MNFRPVSPGDLGSLLTVQVRIIRQQLLPLLLANEKAFNFILCLVDIDASSVVWALEATNDSLALELQLHLHLVVDLVTDMVLATHNKSNDVNVIELTHD